jgi:quinol-cytochrome oxidoreductase complex cytochrome b subunit
MGTAFPGETTSVATKSKRDLLVENAILAPLDWVDERTGAVRGTKWFLFRNVPRDVSWAQTLGSAALTAFIVMALTGVILAMYYEPSTSIDPVSGKPVAYTSIEAITNELTLGWLVRGMHRWGASVFIILLFLHMGRVFLFGAYKYPRELTWITGVLILAMGMLMGFTGYLLPWDQTAYWATVVGINLNGTAPFAGPWLAQFLAGGPEIGSNALAKFYAMHMLLIPGALIALIGVHVYLVTRLGVSSPPWSAEAAGRERPPVQPTGARSGLVRRSGGGD